MKLIYLTILFSLLHLVGCGSTQGKPESADFPSKNNLKSTKENPSRSAVEITHSNQSAKVKLNLDVYSQDVYIKMTGKQSAPLMENSNVKSAETANLEPIPSTSGAPNKPKSLAPTPTEISPQAWEEVKDLPPLPKSDSSKSIEINQVIAEIRKAQEFFYQQKFPEALEMTESSLNKKETAEGFALKGSIHYVMGDKAPALEAWKQSLKLNPDMPKVVHMIQKIQEN